MAPTVVVCGGKDCARKRPDEHGALSGALDPGADVVPTSCLGICKGPVAVLDPEGDAVVVARVRKPKHRRALLEHLGGSPARKPLRSRVVTGKKAKKARRKALKSLRRARGH